MSNPLGDFFAEEIEKGKKVRTISPHFSRYETQGRLFRNFFLVVFFVGGLSVLLARLFVVTVWQGDRFRKLAEENRIREVSVPAPRGILYDREGVALVRNIPVFLTSEGYAFFEQKPASVSGELVESVAREYVFGDVFAHVVGYTGEISEEELESQKSKVKSQKSGENQIGYKSGDMIGKMGIERSKDDMLRGVSGRQLYEVDATEKLIRVLGKIDPKSGKNIALTLSTRLQKTAAEAIGGKKGAVIVSIPKTGEVLALYSSPSFDPNAFVRGKNVSAILQNSEQPLFNRVIAGLYPPGSTFKLVTAIAALESGAITANTLVEDTGVLTIGKFSFGNWYFSQYGKKEGMVNIVKALTRSNDIFFYKIGGSVGIETLVLWGRKVGIESDRHIDLPGEVKGLMPDPVWRKKEKGEDWFLGNTYHVAIGQGDLLTTPLQVAAWTNIIVNEGKLCAFRVTAGQKNACEDLGIGRETIELISEGMKGACQPGGTGWPLFKFKIKNEKFRPKADQPRALKIDGLNYLESFESTTSGQPVVEIPVACKTGTAEFGDPKNKTHAWFTAFAPVYNPQISITVLVEAGGEGSSVAAPIAKKILEEWFSR